MPQLPSGRHVSIVSDSIFELVRMGNWSTNFQLSNHVKAPEDLAALINVVYYNSVDAEGELGEPYFSGFMLSDIEPDKCDWPTADVAFFQEWLREEYVQQWLQNMFDEFRALLVTVKSELPENLRGGLVDGD